MGLFKKKETDTEKDMNIYKKRLIRGESEKSAKAGLKTFEYIDGLITTDEGDTVPLRETDYICPICGNKLYNTKLDGEHYFCKECNKQMKPIKQREIASV